MTVDSETRATTEDHRALRLWLRLLACSNLVESTVRSRLRTRFATTLPRFDFMAQLERCPGGLSMGDISRRMMVSGGNITAIADQLEGEGLVARSTAPHDRRAQRVRLTTAGKRAFREMARAHEGWIVTLFDGLGARGQTECYELLATLKAHLAVAAKDGTR
ncbi:MAG TPA: MarR family transcriptional regulator [Candidatus Eremiobacteraceae bacterium]|nr:MarR family transcriptional regulator [Candidatus Eremiobacteraceae bacterium]